MRKIPTLFVRDFDSRPAYVTETVDPRCEWVLAGEGAPTRKYDGACVMLDVSGKWWARREVKPGKTAPTGYVNVEYDETTEKNIGWEPVEQSSFAKWHAEAVANHGPSLPIAGTYELIGPRVNGNPERAESHVLVQHAAALRFETPKLTFDGIREFVFALNAADGCEGIVWHHGDGVRFAKIKAKDFRR